MDLKSMRFEVFKRVERIIKTHGPRLAGTKADLAAADELYDEIATFADHSSKQDFFVYQGAFLGWIRLLVICYVIGIIFLWFNLPLGALIAGVLSLIILTLQFFLYLPLLDRFYPKKKARNVFGVIEPSGEVKRQVILSGHHDSAHIFNFFIHQPKLYNLRTTGSIALVMTLVVLSTILVFLPNIPLLTLVIQIVLSLGFLLVGQMWFFANKKATPGAGDNLIASSIAITLGKQFRHLRDQGQGLKHTRVIVMSFDAEEEGLRGARAYAKKYADEFKKTPTIGLNMDCLYDEKELFFLTSDLNDFVKLDSQLANDLVAIAKGLNIETKTQKQAFLTGGTDAAELAKKGVKVTTLIGMPWTNDSRSNVYHTPNDTLDRVNEIVVEDALSIYQAYIHQIDQQ